MGTHTLSPWRENTLKTRERQQSRLRSDQGIRWIQESVVSQKQREEDDVKRTKSILSICVKCRMR